MATSNAPAKPMTSEEKKVIFASSLGTVFEWYDFYLAGSLAMLGLGGLMLAAAARRRNAG